MKRTLQLVTSLAVLVAVVGNILNSLAWSPWALTAYADAIGQQVGMSWETRDANVFTRATYATYAARFHFLESNIKRTHCSVDEAERTVIVTPWALIQPGCFGTGETVVAPLWKFYPPIQALLQPGHFEELWNW